MGEEPRSITEQIEKDPERAVNELEQDIKKTRDRLGVYLTELDHRRHRIARQIKQGAMIAVGLGAVAGLALLVIRLKRE